MQNLAQVNCAAPGYCVCFTQMAIKKRAVGRPRKIDGEDTKKQILASARVCFADHGYEATTNQTIAAHAGVTEGTVYHHFRTKQGMFNLATEQVGSEILESLQIALKDSSSLVESYAIYCEVALAGTRSHPEWTKLLAALQVEASRNPETTGPLHQQEWNDIFDNMIRLGIKSGEIVKKDQRKIATVLKTLNLGLLLHVTSTPPRRHKEIIHSLLNLVKLAVN